MAPLVARRRKPPLWPLVRPPHATAAPVPADGVHLQPPGVPDLHLEVGYIAEVPEARKRAGGFANGDPVRRRCGRADCEVRRG